MSIALLLIGLGKSGTAAVAQICARLSRERITPICVGLEPASAVIQPRHDFWGGAVSALNDEAYVMLNLRNPTGDVVQRAGERPPSYIRAYLTAENRQLEPPTRAVERLAWTLDLANGETSGLYRVWHRQMVAARIAQAALGESGQALPVCLVADIGEAVGSSVIMDAVYLTRMIAGQLGMNITLRGYTILPYYGADQPNSIRETMSITSGSLNDEKLRAFTALRELEQFTLGIDPLFGYPFQYREASFGAADSLFAGTLREQPFDQWFCFDRAALTSDLTGVEAAAAAISALRSEAARTEDRARSVNLSESAPLLQRIGAQTVSTLGATALALPLPRLQQRLTAQVALQFVDAFLWKPTENLPEWEQSANKQIERLRGQYPLGGNLRWITDLPRWRSSSDHLNFLESLLLTPLMIEQWRARVGGQIRLPDHPEQYHQPLLEHPGQRRLTPVDIMTERAQINGWAVYYAASPAAQAMVKTRVSNMGDGRNAVAQSWGAIMDAAQAAFRDHLLETLGQILNILFEPGQAGGFPAARHVIAVIGAQITEAESALREMRKIRPDPLNELRAYQAYDRELQALLDRVPGVVERLTYANRVRAKYIEVWETARDYVAAEVLSIVLEQYALLLAGIRGLVERLGRELDAWATALRDAHGELVKLRDVDLTHSDYRDEIVPFHDPLTPAENRWLDQLYERGLVRVNGIAGLHGRLLWGWERQQYTGDIICTLTASARQAGGQGETFVARAHDLGTFWQFCGLVFDDLPVAAELLTFLEQTGTIEQWSDTLRAAEHSPLTVQSSLNTQVRTALRLYTPPLSRADQQVSFDRMRATLLRSQRSAAAYTGELPQFSHADRQRIIYTQATDLIYLREETAAYRELKAFYVRHANDWGAYHAFALDRIAARFEAKRGYSPSREVVVTFARPEHLLRFWMARSIELIRLREVRSTQQSYIFAPADEVEWVLSAPSADPDTVLLSAIKAFCSERTPQIDFGQPESSTNRDMARLQYAIRPRYPFDQPKSASVYGTATTVYLAATLNEHENLLLRFVDRAFVRVAREWTKTSLIADILAAKDRHDDTIVEAAGQAQLWRERAERSTTPKRIGDELHSAAAEILLLAWAHNEAEKEGHAAEESGKDLVRDAHWSGALLLNDHLKRRQKEISQTLLAYLPGATLG